MISKIWTQYKSFKSAILTKSMQKVNKGAVDATYERISKINTSNVESQKHFGTFLFNKNPYIDFSEENIDAEEVMNNHIDCKIKNARQVGCTINIIGKYEFYQEYMECETCKTNFKINDSVRVGISGSLIGHKGHTLIVPKVLNIKFIGDGG